MALDLLEITLQPIGSDWLQGRTLQNGPLGQMLP